MVSALYSCFLVFEVEIGYALVSPRGSFSGIQMEEVVLATVWVQQTTFLTLVLLLRHSRSANLTINSECMTNLP